MTKTFIRDIATRLTALFAILLLLSACGGGGGGGGTVSLTVAGGAQKGPYVAGAVVTAWRLDAGTGARTTTFVVSATDANGNFNVAAIPWTGLTEINVAGKYFDEVANATSTGDISLSALVDLQGNATVRVNLYTHLLAARIRALMAVGNVHAAARNQALTELSDRFDLELIGGVGPEGLNLTDGAGTHRQDNANLLLFSAAMLSAGIDSQGEIDALRDQFASGGRIGDAAFVQIKAAASGLNLDTLGGNLVARYGGDAPAAADLSARLTWTASTLNDTGSTQCSNGAANVACPVATHPTQDAQSGRDANALTNSDADGRAGFSWTKLDAAGNPLAIGGTSWSCVRDNVTGLIWEAKDDAGGSRDKDNIYDHAAAGALATAANSGALCGFSGWRLPTPQELAAMLDASRASGVLADPLVFPLQQAAGYWASTSAAQDGAAAWYLDFSSGIDSWQSKATPAHVRLVRSSVTPPASRYTAHGDGTLSDHQTGLMWRVCSEGLSGSTCATGAVQSYTWQAALQRVGTVNADPAGLGLAHADWRLPNRNELGSIIDMARNPAIDTTTRFPGVQANSHWTSTPVAQLPGNAWAVDFASGNTIPSPVGGPRLVLLVRDL
ncbi:MAG: DUF1566 domain-containing protein [Pseudomonadota bacterium]|nr:DUF1566 domain-containing protein [Pseudomonadota bacterium]MDP1905347.1 DUF1566 domain-containing protein [Pseudomonadota bacterium]MDP2353497.1 DUF1566 domain-containing protein [Pseudomonadota bacterium]